MDKYLKNILALFSLTFVTFLFIEDKEDRKEVIEAIKDLTKEVSETFKKIQNGKSSKETSNKNNEEILVQEIRFDPSPRKQRHQRSNKGWKEGRLLYKRKKLRN